MPCDYVRAEGQSEAQRRVEVETALKRLERALNAGSVKVAIGRQGAAVLAGWTKEARSGVSDVCALRKLRAAGSSALRLALVRAEATARRKVNWNVVGAGVHSHDHGATWHAGH